MVNAKPSGAVLAGFCVSKYEAVGVLNVFVASFQFLSTPLGHLATDAEIIAVASLVQLRLAVMSGKVLVRGRGYPLLDFAF